ncbi:hypothetical protein [Serratia plymuthica]|uniref:hypothetical protein n=1 Tax=Serratia plymuthica TaxID=82996 RepID=UPI000EFFA801|nr:hypothetical protein [Serratia plymuthica]
MLFVLFDASLVLHHPGDEIQGHPQFLAMGQFCPSVNSRSSAYADIRPVSPSISSNAKATQKIFLLMLCRGFHWPWFVLLFGERNFYLLTTAPSLMAGAFFLRLIPRYRLPWQDNRPPGFFLTGDSVSIEADERQ